MSCIGQPRLRSPLSLWEDLLSETPIEDQCGESNPGWVFRKLDEVEVAFAFTLSAPITRT